MIKLFSPEALTPKLFESVLSAGHKIVLVCRNGSSNAILKQLNLKYDKIFATSTNNEGFVGYVEVTDTRPEIIESLCNSINELRINWIA
tara:strand:- start:5776 stop:6042 length:267 start_codon:yes stop_codon:yes gene_type:complete